MVDVDHCDRCGHPLERRNCKEVCPRCGAYLDCSDVPSVNRPRARHGRASDQTAVGAESPLS